MDQKLIEVRKRLLQDFDLYSRYALKIRDKNSNIVPFKMNEAQRVLHAAVEKQKAETGRIRVIILKARQQGLSTYVGGRMYFGVSQRKATKALVMAHKADSTAALFNMVKRYHENCPGTESPLPLRPSTRYSSKRELYFDKLDSAYIVATAGGDAVARGETLTHVHASEQGLWPSSSAHAIWNGLTDAVPNSPGTEIYIESTAQGVSGLFYDNWQKAVARKSEYVPVFIPWFVTPEYRLPLDCHPDDFQLTPEEEDLVQRYGLSLEQLFWRRRKIAEKHSIDLFKQEYPSTPDEAFLTSGRPVFHPEQIARLLLDAPDPLVVPKMALEGTEWRDHPVGELYVYRHPEPGESYVIGADVAQGVGADYSVAAVLDGNKRMVAKWRSNRVYPDAFAEVLYRLAQHYNHARLVVEANNHGILTCYRLSKEFSYDNLYQSTQYDKTQDKETTVVGFKTNISTKAMIIDELRAALRDGEVKLQDKETLREMQSFIVTESLKMEAEAGCHDDCVMSLALANHGHQGLWKPFENLDEYYEYGY